MVEDRLGGGLRLTTAMAALALSGCITGTARDVETWTLDLEGTPEALQLVLGAGDADLREDPEATGVTFEAVLRTNVRFSEDRDAKAIAEARVELLEVADGMRAEASLPPELAEWFLDVVVRYPPGVHLDVDDDSGDLFLAGAASAEVYDDSGDLDITDVLGDLTVRDGSGDLSIRGVGGVLDVDDGSGDLSVQDVVGAANLIDASGDLRVLDAGDVDIQDGSGDIRVESAGHVTIRDGSGDITLRDVASYEIVEDGSGDVRAD